MDDKTIQRIDGAIKLIDKIHSTVDGLSYDEFLNGEFYLEAVAFNIIQLGERMVKLEKLLKDKYPNIPWPKAKAMRNIIVHEYENANPYIIYKTATEDVVVLKDEFLKVKDDIKHISENSIKTKRLLLRPWDDADAGVLLELAKDPEIGKWCGWEPHKNIRDTLFSLHNFLEVKETYAICLKESGEIVGSISLMFDGDLLKGDNECELGFWIGTKYQRNGYAFEAVAEIIRHAFIDLGIKTIWCSYFDGNIKSKQLQEKLGFAFCYSYEKTNVQNPELKHICYVNSLTKGK